MSSGGEAGGGNGAGQPAPRDPRDRMVGLVLVTHGGSGACLLSAAAEIVGPVVESSSVSVVVGEDFADVVRRVSFACDAVDSGAGLLILVDVHGSSEFQACLAMLDGSRPIEIVCGVNLPMLIKLATLDREHMTPATMADILKEVGKRSIRLGSELTGKISTGTHQGPGDTR